MYSKREFNWFFQRSQPAVEECCRRGWASSSTATSPYATPPSFLHPRSKLPTAYVIVSGRTADDFAIFRLLAAISTATAANSSFSIDHSYALSLFTSLPAPTVFSYNAMIRASSRSTEPLQSLCLYIRMLRSGLFADYFTFPFLLRSCASLKLAVPGASIHCHAAKLGLEADIFVLNNAITMYTSLPDMPSAQRLFQQHIQTADVVSWTALITGYSNSGAIDAARSLFIRAPARNTVTYNAMLAAYARAGRARDARRLFDEMLHPNAASWSSLISGFVQGGLPRQALALFHKMARHGIMPNESLLTSAVSACAQLRELEHGRAIHRYIETLGIRASVILGSALVNLYGKCGGIKDALRVFDAMPEKNIYTWNSIIAGLGMSGAGRQALTFFCKMRLAGVLPNAITFIDVLSGCSHGGLVEEGRKAFEEMTSVYGIVPEEEHYGCMVDLMGRAGLIGEALDFVGRMPVKPHAGVWGALAGACRIHGKVEIGEEISRRLIELEPTHGGRYVHLSNMYGDVRRWDDMEMVRRALKLLPAVKSTGRSLVEVEKNF